MTESTVPADTGRAPQSAHEAGPLVARPEVAPDGTAALLLERLEKAIDAELGALRAGVEPLLAEARQSLAALFPGTDGVLLPPKAQQAQREQLGKTLDGLEEVLEALELAVRSGAGAAPGEG